jgi:NhaP-type Na+/H+ or K+/H+ antiporter
MWFKHIERLILGSLILVFTYLIIKWVMSSWTDRFIDILLLISAYFIGFAIDYSIGEKKKKNKKWYD